VRADISTTKHTKDNTESVTENFTETTSKDSKKDVPKEKTERCVCRENDEPTHTVNQKHGVSSAGPKRRRQIKSRYLRLNV
jgi:hypothetical protein